MTLKLLGISGSLRTSSMNSMLLRNAAEMFGGDYTEADIKLPLYNGDDEDSHGIPDSVQLLADQIAQSDAVIISTPEYNGGVSGALKNALDWVSRTKNSPWRGKPVAVMSCAAGRTGGGLAQYQLRADMVPFRAQLIQGPQVAVASNQSEFDANGDLISDRYKATLAELMDELKALASQ